MNAMRKLTTVLHMPAAQMWMDHFSARVRRDLQEMEKHATVSRVHVTLITSKDKKRILKKEKRNSKVLS